MPEPSTTRTNRRQIIKGAAIAAGGVAAVYVKPTFHSLGVLTALAWASGNDKGGSGWPSGKRQRWVRGKW